MATNSAESNSVKKPVICEAMDTAARQNAPSTQEQGGANTQLLSDTESHKGKQAQFSPERYSADIRGDLIVARNDGKRTYNKGKHRDLDSESLTSNQASESINGAHNFDSMLEQYQTLSDLSAQVNMQNGQFQHNLNNAGTGSIFNRLGHLPKQNNYCYNTVPLSGYHTDDMLYGKDHNYNPGISNFNGNTYQQYGQHPFHMGQNLLSSMYGQYQASIGSLPPPPPPPPPAQQLPPPPPVQQLPPPPPQPPMSQSLVYHGFGEEIHISTPFYSNPQKLAVSDYHKDSLEASSGNTSRKDSSPKQLALNLSTLPRVSHTASGKRASSASLAAHRDSSPYGSLPRKRTSHAADTTGNISSDGSPSPSAHKKSIQSKNDKLSGVPSSTETSASNNWIIESDIETIPPRTKTQQMDVTGEIKAKIDELLKLRNPKVLKSNYFRSLMLLLQCIKSDDPDLIYEKVNRAPRQVVSMMNTLAQKYSLSMIMDACICQLLGTKMGDEVDTASNVNTTTSSGAAAAVENAASSPLQSESVQPRRIKENLQSGRNESDITQPLQPDVSQSLGHQQLGTDTRSSNIQIPSAHSSDSSDIDMDTDSSGTDCEDSELHSTDKDKTIEKPKDQHYRHIYGTNSGSPVPSSSVLMTPTRFSRSRAPSPPSARPGTPKAISNGSDTSIVAEYKYTGLSIPSPLNPSKNASAPMFQLQSPLIKPSGLERPWSPDPTTAFSTPEPIGTPVMYSKDINGSNGSTPVHGLGAKLFVTLDSSDSDSSAESSENEDNTGILSKKLLCKPSRHRESRMLVSECRRLIEDDDTRLSRSNSRTDLSRISRPASEVKNGKGVAASSHDVLYSARETLKAREQAIAKLKLEISRKQAEVKLRKRVHESLLKRNTGLSISISEPTSRVHSCDSSRVSSSSSSNNSSNQNLESGEYTVPSGTTGVENQTPPIKETLDKKEEPPTSKVEDTGSLSEPQYSTDDEVPTHAVIKLFDEGHASVHIDECKEPLNTSLEEGEVEEFSAPESPKSSYSSCSGSEVSINMILDESSTGPPHDDSHHESLDADSPLQIDNLTRLLDKMKPKQVKKRIDTMSEVIKRIVVCKQSELCYRTGEFRNIGSSQLSEFRKTTESSSSDAIKEADGITAQRGSILKSIQTLQLMADYMALEINLRKLDCDASNSYKSVFDIPAARSLTEITSDDRIPHLRDGLSSIREFAETIRSKYANLIPLGASFDLPPKLSCEYVSDDIKVKTPYKDTVVASSGKLPEAQHFQGPQTPSQIHTPSNHIESPSNASSGIPADEEQKAGSDTRRGIIREMIQKMDNLKNSQVLISASLESRKHRLEGHSESSPKRFKSIGDMHAALQAKPHPVLLSSSYANLLKALDIAINRTGSHVLSSISDIADALDHSVLRPLVVSDGTGLLRLSGIPQTIASSTPSKRPKSSNYLVQMARDAESNTSSRTTSKSQNKSLYAPYDSPLGFASSSGQASSQKITGGDKFDSKIAEFISTESVSEDHIIEVLRVIPNTIDIRNVVPYIDLLKQKLLNLSTEYTELIPNNALLKLLLPHWLHYIDSFQKNLISSSNPLRKILYTAENQHELRDICYMSNTGEPAAGLSGINSVYMYYKYTHRTSSMAKYPPILNSEIARITHISPTPFKLSARKTPIHTRYFDASSDADNDDDLNDISSDDEIEDRGKSDQKHISLSGITPDDSVNSICSAALSIISDGAAKLKKDKKRLNCQSLHISTFNPIKKAINLLAKALKIYSKSERIWDLYLELYTRQQQNRKEVVSVFADATRLVPNNRYIWRRFVYWCGFNAMESKSNLCDRILWYESLKSVVSMSLRSYIGNPIDTSLKWTLSATIAEVISYYWYCTWSIIAVENNRKSIGSIPEAQLSNLAKQKHQIIIRMLVCLASTNLDELCESITGTQVFENTNPSKDTLNTSTEILTSLLGNVNGNRPNKSCSTSDPLSPNTDVSNWILFNELIPHHFLNITLFTLHAFITGGYPSAAIVYQMCSSINSPSPSPTVYCICTQCTPTPNSSPAAITNKSLVYRQANTLLCNIKDALAHHKSQPRTTSAPLSEAWLRSYESCIVSLNVTIAHISTCLDSIEGPSKHLSGSTDIDESFDTSFIDLKQMFTEGTKDRCIIDLISCILQEHARLIAIVPNLGDISLRRITRSDDKALKSKLLELAVASRDSYLGMLGLRSGSYNYSINDDVQRITVLCSNTTAVSEGTKLLCQSSGIWICMSLLEILIVYCKDNTLVPESQSLSGTENWLFCGLEVIDKNSIGNRARLWTLLLSILKAQSRISIDNIFSAHNDLVYLDDGSSLHYYSPDFTIINRVLAPLLANGITQDLVDIMAKYIRAVKKNVEIAIRLIAVVNMDDSLDMNTVGLLEMLTMWNPFSPFLQEM